MERTVSTELLLLAFSGIPDVSPREMIEENRSGVYGLYADLVAEQKVEDVLLNYPTVVDAYHKFSDWLRSSGNTWSESYDNIRSYLKEFLTENEVVSEVTLPVRHSIYAVLTVLTEIDYFPGYDLSETETSLRKDFGGVSPNLLVTIIKRAYAKYPLSEIEYELRTWYHYNMPGTKTNMTVWRTRFNQMISDLIVKYQLPKYL